MMGELLEAVKCPICGRFVLLAGGHQPGDPCPTCTNFARAVEQQETKWADEIKRLQDFILQEYHCPDAVGFEGPETFPDCGECVYCEIKVKRAVSKR